MMQWTHAHDSDMESDSKALYTEFHTWQAHLFYDLRKAQVEPDVLRLLLVDLLRIAELIAVEITAQKQVWTDEGAAHQ